MYRFWDPERNNHEAGPWVTDADDIDRLRSDDNVAPADIVDRYALPSDADKVTRLDVDERTNVRISEASENFGNDGGGIQYEIRGDDMKKQSSEINIDDMPVAEYDPVDIDLFLKRD